jgi:hypothetical protein
MFGADITARGVVEVVASGPARIPDGTEVSGRNDL